MDIEKIPAIGIKYQKIYVHSFTRSHTRTLVTKWFRSVPADIETILDKTLENISRINVPRTPVIISLLLWISEKQEDYIPINKASLVEKFLETILEKLNPAEIRLASFDYRNKEHYLSYIASRMVGQNTYYFSRLDLEKETLAYFERRGLSASIARVIEYFLRKGVFLETNGIIIFKFKSFCEYFIAKQMIEDIAFYEKLTSPDNYLSFENEIDYMTGLQRNNKSLMAVLAQRLDQIFAEMDTAVDLEWFSKLEIDKSVLHGKEKEQIIKRMRDSRMVTRREMKSSTGCILITTKT